MTELLYFDDPLTFEFTAEVQEARALEGGRYGLVLPRTFFYPTGGGQEHDTGAIGEERVLDVHKANGEILHVVETRLASGEYPARIDRQRRMRAMQHHTGQHILSASFLEVAGIESLSANINGDTPSTIDLDTEALEPEILWKAELYANGILFENREVRSYFVTDADIPTIPFRRPPKVSGQIRVVEVVGLDYTPCGGTHCPNTGMVGILKIVRTERVNQKLRVHFVAGYQALDYFESYQAAAHQAAARLEIGVDGIPAALERKLDQLKEAQAELENLRREYLAAEADRLEAAAGEVAGLRLVTALERGRSASELRALAQTLRRMPKVVAVLAGYVDGKLTLVAGCAGDTGVDARELLRQHLHPLGLKGGGDASLAQGGGLLAEERLSGLFENSESYVLGAGTALS